MDTNSLSKTGRAIPTVSKDTKGEGKKNKLYTRAAILTAAVSNSMMEDGSEEEEAGSLVAHGDRRSASRWMGPGS